MFSYDFHSRGNKAVYSPSYFLRAISLILVVLLVVGFISVLGDGSFTLSAIIPLLFLLLFFMVLIYRDSWTFDNNSRTITYVWGFGPFRSKKRYSYDEIDYIEISHFIKGIGEGMQGKPSWKHKSQVVFSLVKRGGDREKMDIEIMGEKKSGGKVERNASWLSGFTSIELRSDRESLYGRKRSL